MAPLYLPAHVHYCNVDDHCVFLDLRNDRYLCLGREDSDALRDLSAARIGGKRTSAVVDALLARELLVSNHAEGRKLASTEVHTPFTSALDSISDAPPTIGAGHVWHFFASAAAASINLRWLSMESIVHEIGTRRPAQATDADSKLASRAVSLVAVFKGLRALYPRPYLCHFDSLALLHFMAAYGLFPHWVYGVQLKPFGAHCWVQLDDVVLNDLVDNVRCYTPIMDI